MAGFISAPYAMGFTIDWLPETNQFLNRLSPPATTARGIQYNTLIGSLVSHGVWSKLDILYIFAAADVATALTNLKSSSFNATRVNSCTFTTDQGFTGNGVNMRIDTNWNPSTAGGNFTQTSCSCFAWSNTDIDENAAIFGCINDGANNGRLRIYPKAFGVAALGASIQSSTFLSTTVVTGKGFAVASRTSAAAQALYKDGNLVDQDLADAANNVALLNDVYSFLHITSAYSTRQIMCGGMGGGLTSGEQAALYDAVHAYLSAVAGIP